MDHIYTTDLMFGVIVGGLFAYGGLNQLFFILVGFLAGIMINYCY